jgi:hypothetical protein
VFTPKGRFTVLTGRENGWAPKPVCTVRQRQKIILCWKSTSDSPSRNSSVLTVMSLLLPEYRLTATMPNCHVRIYVRVSTGGRDMWHAWERTEKCKSVRWERPKERDQWENRGIDGSLGSKYIFGRLVGKAWIGFIWLRMGICGGLLWTGRWTSGFWRHGVSSYNCRLWDISNLNSSGNYMYRLL